MLVHGEQGIQLHRQIPSEGSARDHDRHRDLRQGLGGRGRDPDPRRGRHHRRGAVHGTSTAFIRGEGGFGGDRGPSGRVEAPDRNPDHVVTYQTRPDQALLYRLSGDRNPLHSDPSFAALGGFDRPILHGLCSYGFTGRALLHALCGSDPGRFRSMRGRFSRPTYPGDTLTVSMWVEGSTARFRTENQRGETVIDAGALEFSGEGA